MIVLDSSAVLAGLQGEPGGDHVLQHSLGASVSAVNVCEVITSLVDRGGSPEAARRSVTRLKMNIVPFDEPQAQRAGELRPLTRHLGLSLGDRACLALAEQLGAKVLTADRPWDQLKLGIDIELIR